MGIQLAVQQTPFIQLNKDDKIHNYMRSRMYSIQATNFDTAKSETYYIKDYAGVIFENIRRMFKIEKEEFIASISPQDFITEMMISSSTIIEELCSTGKSGSLFYYTRDGKYIIKSLKKSEYQFFKKIFKNYYVHIANNPFTLLPKFFGCYKLVKKIKKKKATIYFIVMQNLFSTNKEIHLRYDLKGSTIGRDVLSELNKNLLSSQKLSFALKDLDLERKNQYFFVGVFLKIFF